MTLRNINLERREKRRTVPDKFAFLQLEGDDGGTVLDISEDGLRFESFAAVRENRPMHFWFSLNLRERIEAWGELAWLDEAKQSGGLRFLRLSEEGRAQIQKCISPASTRELSGTIGARETGGVSAIVSRTQPRQTPSFYGTRESSHSSIPFPAQGAVAESGILVPRQRHLAALRRQLIIGVLIGASATGIVAFTAIMLAKYLHENRVGARPSMELLTQPPHATGSTAVTPPHASGLPTDVFALDDQKRGAATHSQAAPPPYVAAPHTARTRNPLTPDQLWTQVQAGNSTAAAALAELYIKGEGVPQSCAQARVLLLVASEKRNAAAIKRLANLDKEGCPAN